MLLSKSSLEKWAFFTQTLANPSRRLIELSESPSFCLLLSMIEAMTTPPLSAIEAWSAWLTKSRGWVQEESARSATSGTTGSIASTATSTSAGSVLAQFRMESVRTVNLHPIEIYVGWDCSIFFITRRLSLVVIYALLLLDQRVFTELFCYEKMIHPYILSQWRNKFCLPK